MSDPITRTSTPSVEHYDLAAEERAKRRYYFVAGPLSVAVAVTVMIAGTYVLPVHRWPYAFALGFVFMRFVEEIVMTPRRIRSAVRAALYVAVAGLLTVWLFETLGFRLTLQ